MTPREIVQSQIEMIKPNLSGFRQALQEALVAVENAEALGIDHPCQLPNIPIDTTNRHALEKAMGGVRFAMIRLCDKGVTSKASIHRFADAFQASLVFPNG